MQAHRMEGVLRGEDSGQDVSDDTANTVFRKDIECVVNSNHKLELGRVVACSSANNAVDNSSPGGNLVYVQSCPLTRSQGAAHKSRTRSYSD